jgi:hypothetical protein
MDTERRAIIYKNIYNVFKDTGVEHLSDPTLLPDLTHQKQSTFCPHSEF